MSAFDKAPRLVPSGNVKPVIDMGIALQVRATEHNIHNVFDDGGYKELILLTMFELRKLQREGDDAEDSQGRRYEVKTVARVSSPGVRKRSLSVTTEHTLTQANIERYRRVYLWIIAVFDQSEPEAIYEITPQELEPFFASWEGQIRAQEALHAPGGAPPHLNNPKIPLGFVREHGIRICPPSEQAALPAQIKVALAESQELGKEADRE